MSRSKSNSQTDPFNAGRPSFGDDGLDSSGAGEQPPESWDYDGPSSSKRSKRKKQRSGERAGGDGGTSSPSSSGSSASASSSSSRSSRPSSYSSPPSAADERAAREDAEQEKKRREQARREANQRKGSDYSTTSGPGYSSTQGTYGSASQQTTRQAGEPKKNHRGCIMTILLCIFFFVMPTIRLCSAMSDSSSNSSSSSSSSSSDEEENGSLQLVQDRLESLADDEELIGLIADDFDRELTYWTDYDAEGLGLDSTEFAEWFLTEASFEGSVDAGNDDDEGSVDLKATERDYDAEYDFVITVRDYLDAEGLNYFSLDELDETQQAEVQTLYDEMLESYDTDVADYTNFRFDLVQNNGEWEIDEDSFEEELYESFIDSNVGGEVDYEERADKIECVNLVYSRLSTLSEDEEMYAYLVEGFNDYLELYAHYDAEELGIDADAFADWYFANLQYSANSIFIEGSDAKVYVYVMSINYFTWSDFGDEVDDYLDEQGVSYYSGQTLTDAQKEHIQGLYDDFIANYDVEDEDGSAYLCFELSEEDGEWILDEDVYKDEVGRTLGM